MKVELNKKLELLNKERIGIVVNGYADIKLVNAALGIKEWDYLTRENSLHLIFLTPSKYHSAYESSHTTYKSLHEYEKNIQYNMFTTQEFLKELKEREYGLVAALSDIRREIGL